MIQEIALTSVGVVVIVIAGILTMVSKFYRKVDQGNALIVNTMKSEPVVSFTGMTVLPIIYRAEVMDIAVKRVDINRAGKDGLICKDNIRADISVTFFVRVNKTADDVLRVASLLGVRRASDQETLDQHFSAKFSEALKTVGKHFDFEELYTRREDFKDEIIKVIGRDLDGYVLDDVAIDYLEQTPLDALDPTNILDSAGIKKITERTSTEAVRTNDLRQKERMLKGQQDLEADEAIFRYDQQRAAAEARKSREIADSQTREQNAATRYRIEEEKNTALANQVAREEVQRKEQDTQRAIEVAQQQRMRIVETEKVEVQRSTELKNSERERDVSLQNIENERLLEEQKRQIAEVIRGRVAVDKTVAQEEEAIKDLRRISDATREKEATILAAQATAEASAFSQVKAAEAEAEMAQKEAAKTLTLAEAELEAAEKQARARTRLAEAQRAEEAAAGLAATEVAEAEATAIEKRGRAEAIALLAKQKAEAEGSEAGGLAAVRVDEARAGSIERLAQADATRIQSALEAEAAGLAEKAKSMRELDEMTRKHEEYRLKLELERAIIADQLNAQKEIARYQAEVLGKAMEQANFQIVGGDGEFFQRFVDAMSLSNGLNVASQQSPLLGKLASEYLEGDASLREDLLKAIGDGNAESVKNLAMAKAATAIADNMDLSKVTKKD